ncbi:unnamed protein product [Calypogeia fissa]
MRAASAFSATGLTRLSGSPLIRQAEGGSSGRGVFLFSESRKKKWGSWIAWMGQKLQREQHVRSFAAGPASATSATRSDGQDGYKNPVVEREEDGAVKARRHSSLVVVSFYKFADLPDYAEMRTPLRELCDVHRVSGGIILAPEGINGSICGTRDSVDKVFATLLTDERFKDLRTNEAPATEEEEELHHGHTAKSPLGAGDDAPFRWGHVRVKLKNEVVPLGVPGVKPSEKVGTYVKPKDWNALISDPKTVVVDVRNDYEIRIGKFKGAEDPKTENFREFPTWVENRFRLPTNDSAKVVEDLIANRPEHSGQSMSEICEDPNIVPTDAPPTRIAMYCTGGIRCEKATSYLIEKGFSEVYHLEGGILKYLEQVTPAESLWEGECFVFDKRVSVEHGLKQGTHTLCYACKKPVNDDDKKSSLWEEGVSCPYCYSSKSSEEKERARARQIQFQATGVIGGPGNGRRIVQDPTNKGT